MYFLHLTFMVRDVEKSIQFYEGFVGLMIQKKFRHGAGDVVFLADQDGATQIELVCVPSPVKVETKGMTICFETPDLDDIYKKAQEKCLNPSDIRNPDPENRYFYVSVCSFDAYDLGAAQNENSRMFCIVPNCTQCRILIENLKACSRR